MQTTILSNGSGDALPISKLFARLKSDPLDRLFEAYGDFVTEETIDGRPHWDFFGNFLTYSHVFSVRTDDAKLAARLIKAIDANRQRIDYQAQEPGKERVAREEAEKIAAIEARAVKNRADAVRILAA